ncbi:enoyl-CoA hydratase/isomerase family protein [Bacillus weihaiensis]|uniref:enoyl-CoA hydratase/isomerase family protein n=1 Tax=Bacillus weihaiensis TaxID=1547283 RepID=UPI00235793D9|nr:enoyl-CoA hydratase/isomerase family protein [Bacillus weihaiensis]
MIGNVKKIERTNGIVELRLNRPMKYNAINYNMMDDLKRHLTELKGSVTLNALIITGEGEKAFCSGGDVELFHKLTTKEEAFAMLSKMGGILYELMIFPVPTIALINGTTLGGGCEIATACDVRIAKQGSSIGFIQGNLGLTTGWGGASMLLEKIAYHDAMAILLSSKKYNTDEAVELGFIDKVIPFNAGFYEKGYEEVEKMLVNKGNVLKAYKQVSIRKWKSSNLYSRMMLEIEQCADLWTQDEHIKAVEAFLNRR